MDERAFSALVDGHRDPLLAHCYRMLGSAHDAEDALQETLVRAWRGGYAERGQGRAWLYRIATNRCLTALEQRGRRALPAGAEVTWLEPFPDAWTDALDPAERTEAREGIELAFVVALQHLPPLQRAVLLLRDALAFSARETAEVLDTTEAAVNSGLQRARGTMTRHQSAEPADLAADGVRDLAGRYASAWEAGDVDAIVALLTDDAAYSMPPRPDVFVGHDAIRGFVAEVVALGDWRFVPARANGQLAFATYLDGEPISLDVVGLRGGRIGEVVSFLETRTFDEFTPAAGL